MYKDWLTKKQMIFIGALALLVIIGLLGFSNNPNAKGNGYAINKGTPIEDIDLEEIFDLHYIGDDLCFDGTTGVLYYIDLTGNRMTIIVNEDGSPKNIRQYISEYEWLKMKEK